MRKILSLLIATLCLALGGITVAEAGEHQSAPYKGSAEFERMKKLVGTWEGTSDMGKAGEKVRVEYRLTSGGSALVETLFPGSHEEMVSVYHDRKGKLAMTHYCMLHNQPSMTLTRADVRTIVLVFDKKWNVIDPAREKHMHAVAFTFTDNNHIIQKWTTYEKGKETGGVMLEVSRLR